MYGFKKSNNYKLAFIFFLRHVMREIRVHWTNIIGRAFYDIALFPLQSRWLVFII